MRTLPGNRLSDVAWYMAKKQTSTSLGVQTLHGKLATELACLPGYRRIKPGYQRRSWDTDTESRLTDTVSRVANAGAGLSIQEIGLPTHKPRPPAEETWATHRGILATHRGILGYPQRSRATYVGRLLHCSTVSRESIDPHTVQYIRVQPIRPVPTYCTV